MTREEAIKELKIFSGTTRIRLSANFWEALNTVIKALEQEPRKDEVILTKKEYGELVSSEFENGYAKGYREAMEEQETCEDAVSRETIVEMLNARGQGSVMTFDHFIELLYKLPPVTPTQRWIPVKERLPETDGEYLLFGKIDDFDDEYYKFIGEFDSAAEKFGICRDCFDHNTLGCLGSEFYEYGEVLAWMPLPDDYKKGVEE